LVPGLRHALASAGAVPRAEYLSGRSAHPGDHRDPGRHAAPGPPPPPLCVDHRYLLSARARPGARRGGARADGAPAAAGPAAPARGHRGCRCLAPARQPQCAPASARDREARLIHYVGATARAPGTTVFGYRSVAERALDDRFACAWTLRSGLYPANADERTLFA